MREWLATLSFPQVVGFAGEDGGARWGGRGKKATAAAMVERRTADGDGRPLCRSRVVQ